MGITVSKMIYDNFKKITKTCLDLVGMDCKSESKQDTDSEEWEDVQNVRLQQIIVKQKIKIVQKISFRFFSIMYGHKSMTPLKKQNYLQKQNTEES